MIKSFARGLSFLFLGVQKFRHHPSLRPWAIAPFVIGFGMFGLAALQVFSQLSTWTTVLLGLVFSPGALWFEILYYPLWLGFAVVVAVFMVYVVYLFMSIIAAPFYSLLAERVLILEQQLPDHTFQFSQWAPLALRMLRVSLIKGLVFLLLGVFLFIFSFVPVLNLVAAFGALLIFAFDASDYTFEAAGLGLRQRLSYFRANLAEFCGMATALGLTLLLPGLTLLILPLAVVGAAQLYKGPVRGS